MPALVTPVKSGPAFGCRARRPRPPPLLPALARNARRSRPPLPRTTSEPSRRPRRPGRARSLGSPKRRTGHTAMSATSRRRWRLWVGRAALEEGQELRARPRGGRPGAARRAPRKIREPGGSAPRAGGRGYRDGGAGSRPGSTSASCPEASTPRPYRRRTLGELRFSEWIYEADQGSRRPPPGRPPTPHGGCGEGVRVAAVLQLGNAAAGDGEARRARRWNSCSSDSSSQSASTERESDASSSSRRRARSASRPTPSQLRARPSTDDPSLPPGPKIRRRLTTRVAPGSSLVPVIRRARQGDEHHGVHEARGGRRANGIESTTWTRARATRGRAAGGMVSTIPSGRGSVAYASHMAVLAAASGRSPPTPAAAAGRRRRRSDHVRPAGRRPSRPSSRRSPGAAVRHRSATAGSPDGRGHPPSGRRRAIVNHAGFDVFDPQAATFAMMRRSSRRTPTRPPDPDGRPPCLRRRTACAACSS